MAFIDGLQRFEGTLVAQMRASLEAARRANAQRQVYRRTVAELNALSTRELTDLGMARSDIRAIARQAAEAAKS